MKLSLSKIRYLSKEILQGRELMLLKSSQALLYKHQESINAIEDVSMGKSVLGNRKLTQSNLNVSKFEACDYIDKLDKSEIQGQANFRPSIPVQSVILDSLKPNDSSPNSPEQYLHNTDQLKSANDSMTVLAESPVLESRFSDHQENHQISEFKAQKNEFAIEVFKVQSETSEAKEATHVPFKYNRRFTIETPPILNTDTQIENPLANSSMRIDSSRFNEFKKELMDFENSCKKIDSGLSSANMTLKKDDQSNELQMNTVSKNRANPTLLSLVEDFSPESKPNKILNKLDEASEHSEITIQKPKRAKNVPMVSRRDVFQFGNESDEPSKFSNSGISQSKISCKSFVSKKDLQRVLNDPANMFLKRKPQPKEDVCVPTNTPIRNHLQLSCQDSVSSIPTKSRPVNSPANCSHNMPHCHCFNTPTIQINIKNNFLTKTPDFNRDSITKRVNSPWMEGKSPKSRKSENSMHHLARLGVNVSQKAINVSVGRETAKESARHSANRLGSFRKAVCSKRLGEIGSIVSPDN
jgi:hypothetical protein